MSKVFVLELIGDPENSGGCVTFSIEGTSMDRAILEELKVEKEKWLNEYLEDDGVDDEGRSYVLFNTDLSSRPYYAITEYDLL